MKQKLLVMMFAAFAANQGLACPVYKMGKMYIIDEHGKTIQNVKVWRFNSSTDSFTRSKYLGRGSVYEKDSNAYFFWSSGGYYAKKSNPDDKYMRIQAKGYADVIIDKLLYFHPQSWDEDSLPILYIKMYPKKYAMKGDLMMLINEYKIDKSLEIKDSLTIGLKDYLQELRSENTVVAANRNAAFVVKTFPNPVIDKLTIQVNAIVTKPYKAILTDMQGRAIREMEIPSQSEIMDMQWELKGIYIIQVYNPEGILLYALKFLKS
jgi:hypothetical protein